MSTTFQVNDMTCGHCASTITNALAALDREAKVNIDLAAQRVQVTSARAGAAELQAAIEEAGYTPVLLKGDAPLVSPAKRGGCGCGCG